MGMESLQSWHLIVLPSSSTCRRPVFARSYFGGGSHQGLAYRLLHPSILFGSSRNPKSPGLERSCSDSLDEFYNEEIEYLARNFDAVDDDENDYNNTAYAVSDSSDISRSNDGESSKNTGNSESLLPSKIEFLEPSFLGIQPEPPDWPERNEIARMRIELRAKSVDIPLSLRMIKRKLKWQKGFAVVRNSAYCSVNRAFASMVLIIQELQSHALYIRESRRGEDLERILEKVHSETECFIRVALSTGLFADTNSHGLCDAPFSQFHCALNGWQRWCCCDSINKNLPRDYHNSRRNGPRAIKC
ncbi:hypothetical protein OIU77_013595 [Salix suchowensis]|uniref:Uncharacterized protein n=1 Tax=Salix suchowensis TaxID=1278906 RepID=A0ABQ8ZV30_9ROSI|nr:hypothetical protein OIU77_013595 [Salix suchowensis]